MNQKSSVSVQQIGRLSESVSGGFDSEFTKFFNSTNYQRRFCSSDSSLQQSIPKSCKKQHNQHQVPLIKARINYSSGFVPSIFRSSASRNNPLSSALTGANASDSRQLQELEIIKLGEAGLTAVAALVPSLPILGTNQQIVGIQNNSLTG